MPSPAEGQAIGDPGDAQAIPDQLPIYPLVTTVLFPSGVAALQIADERSLRLAESLEEEKDLIGLFCLAGDGGRLSDNLADLQTVGVAAKVVQKLRLGEGRLQILCHGLARVELDRIEETEPFLIGRVRPLEVDETLDDRLAAQLKSTLDGYEQLTQIDNRYSPETVDVLRMNADSGPSFLADLLASFLNIPLDEKRSLIGAVAPAKRLQLLDGILEREHSRNAVEADIDKKVRASLEEKRRDHFLREQLKVIQETLGETSGPKREAEQYAAMVEDLPIDDDSKRTVERECERLALMSEQSAEYPVQNNYLDTLFGLPWWEKTKDSLNLKKVERLIARRHHGVDEIKERLLEYLAVIKLKGHISGPILCLAGPPGTGKTSLARSIAEAMGRKFVPISLGGISDEAEIRGHRKTYVGAMPGKLMAAYDKAGAKNPVILLDELDKLGKGLRGDPAAALLEVLDPEQNTAFVDHYIGVPFDLSETLFIATANLLDDIPQPLKDRLEVIRLAGYTDAEKQVIARKFMLKRLLDAHGLEPRSIEFTPSALVRIIRGYTSEAGVRNLERCLATICRKMAYRRAGSKEPLPEVMRIRRDDIEGLLGTVLFEQEFAGRRAEIGVATGLAWTGAGGAILFIEATRMDGNGKVRVTGQLGDVMRESVETAYSYVRAHGSELEIPGDLPRSSDFHIHFPAGAIPKDGPSAGVAAATCLASLLSGRPVRHDVAMTGEITLRGKILSVGGIKEKVLAAHRVGIKKVLLPIGNRKDLVSVPEDICEDIELVFIDRVQDAWKEALVPLVMAQESDLAQYRKPVGSAN
ncbi:MAG: endopeptidase La [Thermoanaerobaculia bacterium]